MFLIIILLEEKTIILSHRQIFVFLGCFVSHEKHIFTETVNPAATEWHKP